MKAINKKTGKEVEITFLHGDHRREYCYADDYKQTQYFCPEAKTEDYEIVDEYKKYL